MKKINEALCSILKDRLKIKVNEENEAFGDKNLFSREIGLQPIDMIYLMILAEEKFNISFTDSDLDSSDFYTINGMSRRVSVHINA